MSSSEFFQGVLKATPLFADLSDGHIAKISECAKDMRFPAQKKIYAEGDPADQFMIIQDGRVAIDMDTPHRGALTVHTVNAGEVLGWSWLFPPYEWHYNARAVQETKAIALDADCLRARIERDPKLGFELMKRFSAIMLNRLEATRMQLMDIYEMSESSRPSSAPTVV